jgi:hypothetical protein
MLIDAITYPNWAGDSKDYKAAQREGRRKRRKYLQGLHRIIAGGDEFSAIPGVDVLTDLSMIEGWFGVHQREGRLGAVPVVEG